MAPSTAELMKPDLLKTTFMHYLILVIPSLLLIIAVAVVVDSTTERVNVRKLSKQVTFFNHRRKNVRASVATP